MVCLALPFQLMISFAIEDNKNLPTWMNVPI